MKRSTRDKLSDSLYLARCVMKDMAGQIVNKPSPNCENKSTERAGQLKQTLGQPELAMKH
ncbi:MAG TPA: hypothetical protein VK716_07525 [Terracidiphilus sp.]|jgi:hypothetical protein|nr:hypothetical protein [Terracidiphilus sp.]